MAEHHFHLKAEWPGGRNGTGTIESGHLKTTVSIPAEMDGPGAGTNPDEMLLGAAATCYIITLAAMLERNSIEKTNLTMESEGIVEMEKGVITYKKIIHRPHLVLPSHTDEKTVRLSERLAEKAEQSCMITRAIKGNVQVELEAKIEAK
ncbi:SACOL1771 family peroxiredoxin [Bacillus mangrovi]|uniref:SACOL1771 family peroxiredoxin n=1 Tax=Metabacillus mangrovi TaxID=1491830 RepID=A0A7X2V4W6_9BACI|nr:OsmC family protein [Metabacillus mangrovi]MTH53835.1 SACOL1771 family peroxiredoxin [Metabacillus mangrovi]